MVTNNHVIQDADDIIVRVNGDQEYKAKVLGADPLMDIAVLQLDTEEKFKPVDFGDSDKALSESPKSTGLNFSSVSNCNTAISIKGSAPSTFALYSWSPLTLTIISSAS